MEPLSPRKQLLPPHPEASTKSSALADRARYFEALAQNAEAERELDAYEACLRESFNLWLACREKEEVKLPALVELLLRLGQFHRENSTAADALRLFEKAVALQDTRVTRQGGFADARVFVQCSEALTAAGRAGEAVEMAKRSLEALFRKYPSAGGVGDDAAKRLQQLPRQELEQFGNAWHSLAMAEEALLRKCDGDDDERSARAVEILVHFRRGVKCAKDLLGDDPTTSNMERRYHAAKKMYAKLAEMAPKERMPPVVAAYPGDKSGPSYLVELAQQLQPKKPDGGAAEAASPNAASKAALPRMPSAKPQRQQSARPTRSDGSATGRQPSASASRSHSESQASPPTRRDSAVRDSSVATSSGSHASPSHVMRAKSEGPTSSTMSVVRSAREVSSSAAPDISPRLRRKSSAVARLDPISSPPRVTSSARVSHDHDPSTFLAAALQPSPPKQLAPIDESTAMGSSASPERRASRSVQALLTATTFKRGLQLLFVTIDSKKRACPALRFVYLYVRDMKPSFPHFHLNGEHTLHGSIKAQEDRLNAMEFGEDHTKLEAAVAKKVRTRQSIDSIKRQKQEKEMGILFADMDKRTERYARRYKSVQQTMQLFMMNLDRHALRVYFRKWVAFLGPRRAQRPLRRAAAHLFKQIDRQLLRRRFITWLRWLKERKRSVFALSRTRSTAQSAAVQRSLHLMKEQEVETVAEKERARRKQEADETFERHRSQLEQMQRQLIEAMEHTPEPVEEPPKVPMEQLIRESTSVLLAALQAASSGSGGGDGVEEAGDDSEAVDTARVDDACRALMTTLNEYAESDDFRKEVERLPCDPAQCEANTAAFSPVLITLVVDERFHSPTTLDAIRHSLRILYHWVDFHRIFFEEEVLLDACRSGFVQHCEALLDSIPGFTVSPMGHYVVDLLSLCVKHESHAVALMETLLLKCEHAVPFHLLHEAVSPLLLHFFERWVPTAAKSLASRRQSLYDPTSESAVRARVVTLFERVLLDVRAFRIPHEQELFDKQTLFSRMCGAGDQELVELYANLIDHDTLVRLLSRKQSDNTTCLVQAIRSRNVGLVRYLLTDHEDVLVPQLAEKYDGLTVVEVAQQKNCGSDMIALLKEHGAADAEGADSDHMSSSRPPSSRASASGHFHNIFADDDDRGTGAVDDDALGVGDDAGDLAGDLDDLDRLMGPAAGSMKSEASSSGLFSSPHPPDGGDEDDSFHRLTI